MKVSRKTSAAKQHFFSQISSEIIVRMAVLPGPGLKIELAIISSANTHTHPATVSTFTKKKVWVCIIINIQTRFYTTFLKKVHQTEIRMWLVEKLGSH